MSDSAIKKIVPSGTIGRGVKVCLLGSKTGCMT